MYVTVIRFYCKGAYHVNQSVTFCAGLHYRGGYCTLRFALGVWDRGWIVSITSIQAKDIRKGDLIVDSGSVSGRSYPVTDFRLVCGQVEVFCGSSLRSDIDTRTRYMLHPAQGVCVVRGGCNMSLYEQFRPGSFGAVLGQDRAVSTLKRLCGAGIGGRAVWISGASGTGKTTLARIAAGTIADGFFMQEYDAADALLSAEIDSIERQMCLYGGGKGGRAFIINEAHGLKKSATRRLLGILERIPKHVCFIFTTTRIGQESLFEDNIDASPLLSRCIVVNLTNQGLAKVFAVHCRKIATDAGLNGKPMQSYIRLAQDCKNNCRAMLQAIEAGDMMGVTNDA